MLLLLTHDGRDNSDVAACNGNSSSDNYSTGYDDGDDDDASAAVYDDGSDDHFRCHHDLHCYYFSSA